MQIFFLDKKPSLASQYHFDIHVNKSLIETAQILSTVHHLYQYPLDSNNFLRVNLNCLYKPTHQNHPDVIWCCESKANYIWLYQLFCKLGEEYKFRFEKDHLTNYKLLSPLSFVPDLPDKSFTFPPLVMPDDYKLDDPVESYRNYYRQGKSHLLKYTKREKPEWLNV